MRFSVDHYCQIGHKNFRLGKPCQDHALSKSNGSFACAIVSDGCSSGENTDIGSLMITLGTLQAIRDHAKVSGGSLETAEISITVRQEQLIGIVRPMLGLERNDMLATCLYAYVTQKGGLVHLKGDGVMSLKYRDGTIVIYQYEWADNMPFYPSYEGDDLRAFREHHGNVSEAPFTARKIIRKADGTIESDANVQRCSLEQGIAGISLHIPVSELAELDCVAVFSDGVTQIGNLPVGDDPITMWGAVSEFLAFKTMGGEFVKRRMIRGIKDLGKIGKGLIDDISCAVIHIEEHP